MAIRFLVFLPLSLARSADFPYLCSVNRHLPTMRHARHILPLALILLLAASCDRGGHYGRLLAEAERMNRNDSLFTSDSVGLALVRHYDHWWYTRNQRMRAYYMLGCAYRDMGEAPAALHYYNIAVEQADTAKADSATYATLFRVYGQMAVIYEQQNMPQEELKAWGHYGDYARLAKDTFNGILGYERMAVAYYALDDTAMVYETTETASRLYREAGYENQAARVFPTAIYVSLLNGNYGRARRYMDVFESESGLFDKDGNIAPGREHYYNSKGIYYLAANKTDSAEYYFRRLLSHGHLYEACKGLLSVYQERKNTDSIVKYSRLTEETLLRWSTKRQAEAVIRSSAMYKYERNLRLAMEKEKEARTAWSLVLLLVVLAVMGFMFACHARQVHRRKEAKRRLEHQQLDEKYNKVQQEYLQKSKNLIFLRQSYKLLRQSTAEEIGKIREETQRRIRDEKVVAEKLRQKLESYQSIIDKWDIAEREESLREQEIVTLFDEMGQDGLNGRKPNKKEWERLIRTYRRYLPHMFSQMKEARLSEQEMRTCILADMAFPSLSIETLLNVSPQTVRNAKANANRKLSGESHASMLPDTLKKMRHGFTTC